MSFEFAQPWLLLLLLLLPLLAILKGRRGEQTAFLYSSTQVLRGLVHSSRSRAGTFLAALRWLTLALFITALARPQFTESQTKVTASGVDIVVALDLSGSMAAEDFEIRSQRVNRLAIAKSVLEQFIEKRPNDRIGLVAFATDAYVAAPLTLDQDYLLKNLERLNLDTIDSSKTAVGSALSTALNRLREVKSKSKIVILMTDGQSNSGKISPLVAAEAAEALAVKVYTIGVGSRGTAPMPYYAFGQKGYRNVPVDIDEETLKAIADRTGGIYYRADNAEKLQSIYDEIDSLEKTEIEVDKHVLRDELFRWFVLAGMGTLLIEIILGQTVWRRLP
jgi:Ca-activated chloride channel family protein